MSEMIERIAEIIWYHHIGWTRNESFDAGKAALAVIAAMREPSEAMMAAVPAGHVDEQREILKKNWASMINAALK